MPFVRAKKEEFLNLYNIMLVTQKQAGTPEHKKAYQEVVRVDGIVKKRRGVLGQEAEEVLVLLANELLSYGVHFNIKLTHPYFPNIYFLAVCPRYMEPPSSATSVVLRWKMGKTIESPYSCLELVDKNRVFLPWFTVDTLDGGFKKCEQEFADYPSLVRHLATRHMVMWLSYRCPWCATLGFERVKIMRHVASCKAMPKVVVALVEAVEKQAEGAILKELSRAASADLLKIAKVDNEFQFKRRETLAMTRAEALWRAYAEKSDKASKKERWNKTVTPKEMGYPDDTGLYCINTLKYPKFVTCASCEKVYLDTQIASREHLAKCDLRGFMTYHAKKSLGDESILSDGDRSIFKWKSVAEKAVKEKFLPTVICTLDGYGAETVSRNSKRTMADLMKERKPWPGTEVRQKRIVVGEKVGELTGRVQLLGPAEENLKTELVAQALSLPKVKEAVQKRKITVDYGRNVVARCQRRTYMKELFPPPHIE